MELLLHDFVIELGPVGHAAKHATHMDKVEAVPGEAPLLASVVDLKLEVGRDFVGLGRR